jgi:hypothetical protein
MSMGPPAFVGSLELKIITPPPFEFQSDLHGSVGSSQQVAFVIGRAFMLVAVATESTVINDASPDTSKPPPPIQ